VTGAHTHNFHAIVDLLDEAGAIVQLPPAEGATATEELTRALAKLLDDASERAELGRRAKELVTNNQGAATRTMKLITPLLSTS
jgi:3-deoxy-D-manno-octulosonic-acid transferase